MNFKKILRRCSAAFTAVIVVTAPCLQSGTAHGAEINLVETTGGITINNESISSNNYKNIKFNNPISSEFFCADPTAVEYNGRLYLYGTNDHQQFEVKGSEVDNTYEQIKSMVVMSTDDMVNWVYHGEINIGEIAPWITNSWAPSVTSRIEEDGKTHFYMYFSNNGLGVGVITATDPLGPWSDPLGKPLISTSTPGLSDCPNPFDPGVVIDENGVGWLAFGGGKASNGTDYMPGSTRIVQLGDDMLSFASDFKEIPAPYFFEASELNYINDTYVYTYNTDWSDHSEQWDYDCEAPSQCSMVYMTTKTPLDPESWEMKGECFINPGTAGFDYSNNHTHMHKFKDKWYMFFHTLSLKTGMGIKGAYRSLCADEINVDEENVIIEKTGGTKQGLKSAQYVDPFISNQAASLNTTADIEFDTSDMTYPFVISDGVGSWTGVRDIEFTASESSTPQEPAPFEKTAINTITYNFTVKTVDKATTVYMNPATNSGENCTGQADISGTGSYTITCDTGGANGMMNMGYFSLSNDAQITFVLDTMIINDKYEFDIAVELTNTREWADGLKNIWNGFSDGDKVYSSEYADFIYNKSADSIEFHASPVIPSDSENDAPLVSEPLTFYGTVKGTGRVELRLDSPTGDLLTSIDFESPDEFVTVYNKNVASVRGVRDIYFVFSDKGISMIDWRFEKGENSDIILGDVNADGNFSISDAVAMQKYLVGSALLKDSSAGDMNSDSQLDIFDLSLMKNKLLK